MPGNRLGRGLVSLAASAITAVYAAGYLHTQAADQMLGTATAASPAATTAPAAPAAASQLPPVAARVQPTATPRGAAVRQFDRYNSR